MYRGSNCFFTTSQNTDIPVILPTPRKLPAMHSSNKPSILYEDHTSN